MKKILGYIMPLVLILLTFPGCAGQAVGESQNPGEAENPGEAFLEQNKKADGIVVLNNGLQYRVIQQGTGKKPHISDTIVAHYKGTLINGTVFDSSYQRNKPATFALRAVIRGWQEILTLMPVGSKWQVFIPPDLAYGTRGAGRLIGPNETLIFDIELIAIK